MFLEILNAVFINISNYMPHLELRNHSFQIVVITNVGIKWFDCISASNSVTIFYFGQTLLEFFSALGEVGGLVMKRGMHKIF